MRVFIRKKKPFKIACHRYSNTFICTATLSGKGGGMIYSGVVHHTDVYFPYIWEIQAG